MIDSVREIPGEFAVGVAAAPDCFFPCALQVDDEFAAGTFLTGWRREQKADDIGCACVPHELFVERGNDVVVHQGDRELGEQEAGLLLGCAFEKPHGERPESRGVDGGHAARLSDEDFRFDDYLRCAVELDSRSRR